MRKKLFMFLGIILTAVVLVACGKTTYEVSFDTAGGTPAVAAKKVEKGALVSEPTAPTKENHTFLGWFLDGEKWNFATDKVTKNIKLVARWEEVDVVEPTLTVTFDTNGGSPAISPVEVVEGEKVSKPADPTKDGAIFLGWYVGNDEYDFDEAVTANITLVAKWQEAVEVAFDVRGGTPAIAPILVVSGEKVDEPTAPTRDGYAFLGWLLDGEEFDFDTPITEDILLVAQWQQKEYVLITLVPDGGEPVPASPVQHEKGTLFAEPATMTRDGYEFVGWFNQITDEAHNFAVPVEGNLVLIAKWDRVYENYTITFDINYAEGEVVEDQIVQEEDYAVEPQIEERIGYRFMGWYEADATEPFDFSSMILSDHDLIAKWHLEHVVTFDINYPEGTNPAPVLVLDGEKLSAPTIGVREFYDFIGWYLDEELYDFEEVVTEDLHLVAKWNALETYLINYHNVDEEMFVYGTQEAMFEAYLTDFHTFLKSGFSLNDFMHGPGKTEGFDGLWVEAADSIWGGPKPTDYNETYFASAELYMDKWMPFHEMIHEWIMIVNPDQWFFGAGTYVGKIRIHQFITGRQPGGNETAEDMLMMPDPLIAYKVVKEHLGVEALELPVPYREDGRFLGWYDNENFEGEPITEIPANTEADMDLYARWEEIVRYDVTFDIGYEEGINPEPQSVLEDNKVNKPAEPARRPGFRFVGWFLDLDDEDAYDFGTPVTSDLNLVAKWREVTEFEVTFDYDTDGVEDLVVWVEDGEAVAKPANPTKDDHVFVEWLLDEQAYDFETPVTEAITLVASWSSVIEYTVTYELDGGKFLGAYADRFEMVDAFLEAFYAYLDIEDDLVEFKHGVGKTEGYDGTWHSEYKDRIYSGNRPVEVDEDYFASSSEYMENWLPFFDTIHDFVVVVNKDQFFWDTREGMHDTSVGLIRIKQYVMNAKPAGFVTEEQMRMMPEEYKVVLKYENISGAFDLIDPVKAGFEFDGWYDNAEFTGDPITGVSAEATGDLTFYAKWIKIIYHDVEFEIGYEEGITPEQQSVLEDEKASEPAEPARRPGYRFEGWFLDLEDENPFDFDTPITEPIVLYAKWREVTEYEVTLDLNTDGVEDIIVWVEEGEVVIIPEGISKEDHHLEGWLLNEVEFDLETPITGNITLVADWRLVDEIEVTFDLGYEGSAAPTVVEVAEFAKVTKPADPTRETYVFAGWYLGENEYDFNEEVVASITLVAKWEPALLFTFGDGNLSVSDISEYVDNTHIVATRYSNTADGTGTPIVVGPGRSGAFWHTMGFKDTIIPGVYELVGKGTAYENTAEATLYIYYHDSVAGDYAAAIKAIYGSIQVGDLVVVPTLPPAFAASTHVDMYFLKSGVPSELLLLPSEISELIVPVREGYNFGGWYDNPELEGTAITEVPEELLEGLKLYPKWEMDLPKLENAGFTVDSNGNLVFTLEASGADLYSLEIDHNFEGTLPEFTIYADNDSIWGTSSENPADYGVAATYLNGVWTITFTKGGTAYKAFLNGGKSSLAFYFVIANNLGDEWGSMFEVTPENTREIDIVTVSFDIEEADQILFAGDKAVEPATPTKEGFLFGGWFVGEEEFNFSTAVTENILITALWNDVATVEVTFNLNYEGAEPMASVVIEENTAVTKPADPVRAGYDFLGWFVAEAEVAYDFSALVAADLALEARWLLIEMFTISYELDGGNLYLYNTREEMVADFIADYNAFKNKTLTAEGFQAGTYGQNVFEIFTSEVYGAKWIWMRNYIIQVAGDQAHASKSQLEANDDGQWRGSIDSFLNETVRTAWPASADYTNEPAKNGFWPLIVDIDPIHEYQHGYEFVLPVPEKDQADFLGWYLDAEFSGERITKISAEERENITLYAKWTPDVQLPEMIIDWDFGTVAKTGYAAGDLTWTNGDLTEVTANKDRAQINTSTYAPHNGEHFLILSIRDTASEAWIELDFTTLTGMNKISFEINVWNNTLLEEVKDTPDGLFILQVKDGENWVNVQTTNAEANLLPLLTFEEYVEVAFDVDGPGLYRIMYSGESTAGGNTTTAVTVDNLKVFK